MEYSNNNITIALKKDSVIFKDIAKLRKIKNRYDAIIESGFVIIQNNQYCYSCDNESEETYNNTMNDIEWIKKNESASMRLYAKIYDYINKISKEYHNIFDISFDGQVLNINDNKSHYSFYYSSLEISIFISDYIEFLKSEIKKLRFD
jgi:hypothetical protein